MLRQARAPRWVHDGLTVVTIGLLVGLPMAHVAMDPDVPSGVVASVARLIAYAALVAYGVALGVDRRLRGEQDDTWLVVVLTAVGLQGVYWSTLEAAGAVTPDSHPVLAAAGQVAGTLLVLLAAHLGDRVPGGAAPVSAGVVLATALIVVRSGAELVVPVPPPGSATTCVAVALLLVDVALAAAVAFTLRRLAALPAWAGLRVGGAVVLIAVAGAAVLPARASWPEVIACLSATAAAVALLATAVGQTGETLRTEREVVMLLRRRLDDAEAELRTDRSRSHEIRATLAGIAAASDLLHHRSSAVSPSRRAEIEAMMDSELARLERLTTDASSATPGPIDLDATLLPLVLRHRLRGGVVRWEPSGLTAWGRADDVAEITSVLLENAHQHAPGAEVRVQARAVEHGRIEVIVSDTGPGVDPALGSAIFAWGGRRSGSPGEGIGLSTASRLSASLGGYLRLVETAGGAAFALGVPTAPVRHDREVSA